MGELYHLIFFQPILNLLVYFYDIVPGNDLGLAIILLTAAIKLLLWPLSQKSIKSQKALTGLQPKIEELKKKFGNNKEAMGKAMMQLYRENKVNPFSSCLPLLLQFPFLIAVFQVFRTGLGPEQLELVYSFISRPESIEPLAFGFLDLSKTSPALAIAAGLAQFWQAKMLMTKKAPISTPGAKDENVMSMMNKQMLYIMPAITVFIGLTFPGGLVLYWLTTTLLTVLQQWLTFRRSDAPEPVKNN